MTLRRSIPLLLIVLLSAASATAQPRRLNEVTGQSETLAYLIGGYGSLNLNYHAANFGQLPGFPSCCAEYGNTTALGPAFGVSFELPFTSELGLQLRLGYSSLSGLLSATERIGNEPVLGDGPSPGVERQAVTVEHTLDASMPMVVFEPTVGVHVFDLLLLSAGARGGYMLSSTFDQKETLLQPEGYTFLDGTTVRNAASADIPNANTVQLHGVFGLGYELHTRGDVSIVPEVRYYLPLTKISDVDWAVQSFQVGVNVRWGSYVPVDPTIKSDTVYVRDTIIVERLGITEPRLTLKDRQEDESSVRDGDVEYRTTRVMEYWQKEVPRPFNPGLRSSIMAVRPDGTMGPLDALRVEELDVIESYPLLPQVFFPEGSADLAQTQQMRLDAEDVRSFRPTELSRDQIDVYRNMLNIMGARLQQNPRATIIVEGHVNNAGVEQNNRELSRQRAEAVKAYLTDVWGIEPQRITVRGGLLPQEPANPNTPDGKAENQRVEIQSNDPAVLEPVEFRDKDLIIAPRELVVRPELAEAEGVRDWSLSMRQGSRELYRNDGSGVPKDVAWDASRADTKPSKDGPIVSTLSVRDANGASATSSDTLNVDYVTLQTMKARQEEGKMVERYSLIVFDFNSAQLNASNQRIMQRVKQRIQPESKVRITGFADRQGNPEYNRELARKRCLEAQRVLGLSDDRVTIEPVGSDRLIFDNETPVGRSYSRTVQIEIVTPVR